jgi:hypothetical protein
LIPHQQNTPLTNEVVVENLDRSNVEKENNPIVINHQNNPEKENNSVVAGSFITY